MLNPLTPEEVSLFRALIKSAVVVLLMLRLGKPTGARELADILNLDEHTVSKHLRALARLNLVGRTGRYSGYFLLDGSQLIPGSAATVKNLQAEGVLSPIEQALKDAGISNPQMRCILHQVGVSEFSLGRGDKILLFISF
jgi:DNA-binding transcriptional regulator YhcF (GntR family)